jgi:putative FmdB family regulatory protein
MPIFDFRCAGCGHEFEKLVLRSSAAVECPSCGGTELEKLISMPAVSSENTRRMALDSARARNSSTRRDIAHEEHQRFHDHEH